MKTFLSLGAVTLALCLQNSCCTPHLNTSGKISEVGKNYEGFASELPSKVYLKNGVYYAEVKKQSFSYSAPLIDHSFCPNTGETNYEPIVDEQSVEQTFYFPLVSTSLPMSKEAYMLQLKAQKNTLISEQHFDKTGARSIPVKNIVSTSRMTPTQLLTGNDPVIIDTTTTTTNKLVTPLAALDAIAIDLPLTVAGGIPLVVGSGLYKGGQWVGSLFNANPEEPALTDDTVKTADLPISEEEAPVEEVKISPANPPTPQSPSSTPAIQATQAVME